MLGICSFFVITPVSFFGLSSVSCFSMHVSSYSTLYRHDSQLLYALET